MKLRNLVVVLLFMTVVAPIFLYTDKFKTPSSSKREFLEDVTSLTFGGDDKYLDALSLETSGSIKVPVGVVYSDHSSVNNVKNTAEAQDSQSSEKRKHKYARVLSTTSNQDQPETENPLKQVTDANGVENTLNIQNDLQQTFGNKVHNRPKQNGIEKQTEQIVVPDAKVRVLKDQLIRARVYLSLPAARSDPHFVRELRLRIKEVQRVLGDASKDSDLPRNVNAKMRAMERTLARGRQIQDDCSGVVKKLRAMLHSTEEQLRVHKKQTIFLTQLTAKTIPKGLHCLPLRLMNEYYSLNASQQQFPNQDKLEDPQLFHYALFSDNILAAAVVVNSTITNAKHPSRHVFHIVTDRLNYAAMRMWFLAHQPGKATVQVQNIEEFTWLNSSYSPVLRQLGSRSMIDYYFRADGANSDTNLKYRNPKYLSILNHLRFYLPEIFPKLNKVLFVDDDIVVQKDLSGLWSLDLNGNVNGAVETCGESFHRFDRYLNFSNPLISKNFDPHACGWAYGMNVFDLDEWRRQNITEVYHRWQNLNQDRQLWKLGTLPPGLITFWKNTHPINRHWHVLGLGYNPNVNQKEIERAAVVHYNGNLKPWLEIGLPRYRGFWSKYVDYDHLFLRECNINP